MKEKVIKMLKSSDAEMQVLGAKIALSKGPAWCRKNLNRIYIQWSTDIVVYYKGSEAITCGGGKYVYVTNAVVHNKDQKIFPKYKYVEL